MTIKKVQKENHEITYIFPSHEGKEIERVKEYVLDCQEKGIQIIVYTYQGKIIDGRMTYKICLELGIEPSFKEVNVNPIDFIVQRNLPCRILTPRRLMLVAYNAWVYFKNNEAELPREKYERLRDKVADLFGVGSRNLEKVKDVFEKGIKALQDKYLEKEISTDKAQKVSMLSHEEQNKILDKAEFKDSMQRYFEVRSEIREQNDSDIQDLRKDYILNHPGFEDRVTLYHGDMIEEGKRIKDSSINALISDVPYEKKDKYLINHIGELAKRVLVKNGVCVLMVGQNLVHDYAIGLKKYLNYKWQMVYFMGHGSPKLKGLGDKIFKVRYKPILVFCKGRYNGYGTINDVVDYDVWHKYFKGEKGIDWEKHYNGEEAFVPNVIEAGKPDNRKNDLNHPHAQHIKGFQPIINCFTRPGETILDPFSGTGVTSICALRNHCNVVTIEKNDYHFKTTENELKKEFDRLKDEESTDSGDLDSSMNNAA